jgi:outer membrane protein assembly factor BamB
VWLAAGPTIAPAASNNQWLTLVDSSTLAVNRQLHLPGQPGSDMNAGPQLAGSSNLLWLGYGTNLFRLNPDTGDTLSSQKVAGTVTSLSLDPSGQHLYVGLGPSQTQPATVLEIDASTGSRLASANTGGAGLGGPRVAASADGVWVSYATGTMGLIEHRSAGNLALLGNTIRTSNTVRAVVDAGALWIVDGMAQRLTCADPVSGATRASTAEIQPSTISADSGGAYLGDNTGVAALQPPAPCRG